MQITAGPHLSEEILERYALDQVPEESVAPLEEHLLLCERCQLQLDSIETHLRIGQEAARELRRDATLRKKRWWDWLSVPALHMPALAAAFGVLVVVASIPVYLATRAQDTAVTVELESSRGTAEALVSHARSGKIVLAVDARQLPAQTSYRMQMVNSDGIAVWAGTVATKNQRLLAPISQRLDPGQYWVRLYRSGGATLIKEFGLEIR